MKQQYTLDEAAYILGVNKCTLYHWIREGKLEASYGRDESNHRIVVITESQLEDCLVRHTQRAYKSINRSAEKNVKKQYLEYLDQREDELYSEICLINQMREFAREMEL